MTINSENKQAIHDVMIADMQKRLFKQHNEIKVRNSFTIVTDEDYDNELSVMVDEILHTSSISDINNVLIENMELFPNEYFTLEGTLNYVLQLLCSKIIAHENDLRKYSI